MKDSVFLLVLLTSIACQSQESQKNEMTYLTIDERVEVITTSFAMLSKSSDTDQAKGERVFFEAFPDSFEEFIGLYDVGKPLYEVGHEHLKALYDLKTIPQDEIVAKYTELAKHGTWRGDNTGQLQWQAFELILTHAETANKSLKNMSRPEIESVFHFLLDGPHPEDSSNKSSADSLVKVFNDTNPAFAEIIKGEYAKLIKETQH